MTVVAAYEFNGTLADTGGAGHNGAAVGTITYGAALPASTAGGRSLALDGTGHVSVADAAELELDGPYWITQWLRPSTLEPNMQPLNKGSEDYFLFMHAEGGLEAGHRDATGEFHSVFVPSSEWVAGREYRVDLVFTGTDIVLLVNGLTIGEVGTTEMPRTSAGALLIGAEKASGANRFHGEIGRTILRDATPGDFAEEILAAYRAETPTILADDFDSGANTKWSGLQNEGATAATSWRDAGGGNFALHSELSEGDVRTELTDGNIHFTEGDLVYFDFLFSYVTIAQDPGRWGDVICQAHQDASVEGSPPMSFGMEYPARLVLGAGDQHLWEAPEWPEAEMHRATIGVLFSADGTVGRLELWIDKVKQTLFNGLLSANAVTLPGEFDYPKVGYYRDSEISTTGAVEHDQFGLYRHLPFAEVLPLPPAAEDGSELWSILYRSLGFHRLADAENEFALRVFCEGWCAPLQRLHDLQRERPDAAAWEALFDPDRCPAESLPYLAQFVGVGVTPEMTEAQIREEIRQPTGWRRGQTPSIETATRRTLSSTEATVIVRPRTPELGRHYIRTLLAETPEPVHTAVVVREETPAWEVIDYEAIAGVTYDDARAAWATYADAEADLDTYDEARNLLPEELPTP